jgi:hypothetical protein
MKKYHIYHIEGIKIGCSDNPKKRVKVQGYTQYTILETHDDIITASNREIELQKEYGYKVDTIPYYQTLDNATYEGRSKGGTITGNNNIASGLLSSICGLGGKINGNKIAIENPKHFKHMSILGSKKGGNATKYKKEYAILAYKYNTGEYVGEYPNQTEASKQLNLHTQNIGQVLLGNIKHTGGYTFQYKTKKVVLL